MSNLIYIFHEFSKNKNKDKSGNNPRHMSQSE